MTSQQKEIVRLYLRTGESDRSWSAWPGQNVVEREQHEHAALRRTLVAEVRERTRHGTLPEAFRGLDVVAFTRAKVAPMVQGLFPGQEQATVLDALGRSVIFLTPANIDVVLAKAHWHGTAWNLANLYLASFGGQLLSGDAPEIVGLSEETTCYVSIDYFQSHGRFADFVVHEVAHIFHNCKRKTIGLTETRSREWLLPVDYAKRETFAYACEAYGRILEQGPAAADRRRLLSELQQDPMPPDARVDTKEYIAILSDAIAARNGWKRILKHCSPRVQRGEIEAT